MRANSGARIGKFVVWLLAAAMGSILILSMLLWWDIRHAPHLTPDEVITATALGNAKSAPLILDVRTETEFARAHLPKAVNVPFFSYASLAAIDLPKDRTVVVYCELGPRAAWARWMLRLAGFMDVKHLHGHMAGWRDAKMPVQNDASPRQQ